MSSRSLNANVVAVECKRYGQSTELDERELLGELVQATRAIPDLDLWVLVTSRELSSRLYESLNSFADEKGIGFVALSSGDGSPSSLEVLCANSPEIVINHSAIKAVADSEQVKVLLQSIIAHKLYRQQLAALKETFSSPLAGYANWRRLNNQSFLSSLASEKEARAHYGQPINVEDGSVMLVQRAASTDSLNKWYADWKNKRLFFATLGEEGDGKSWAVASWLSAQVKSKQEFPAVLFLSSSDLSEADYSILDLRLLFTDLISARSPHLSKDQVRRQVDRWLSRPVASVPFFVLVLDGINERRDNSWWRRLFERLAGDPWSKHVAVLVTCRTSYWETYFKRLRHLPASSFVIGPYNDEELDAALAHHKLQRDSLQATLFPLIRKPRYFDLMIKHQEQIAVSGDVTVARLLFEDWRDRWERKQSTVLTPEEFQNVIRQLAQRYQEAHHTFHEQEITEALPARWDRSAILEDLRTGGVLKTSGGRYKVNDHTVVFGLGLVLVDQLQEASHSKVDPREVIASWMEPQADMDIKAAICEFAALYVLGSDILPRESKAALLDSWVGSHNPGQNSETDLTAYLPIDSDAYVALAEHVWSDASENRWAQEVLRRSFLRWYDSPSVSNVLRSTFERWLGLVHINGSPLRRHNNEEAERNRRDIAERLGGIVELGPTTVGTYGLTVIDDDGQLRLARVALSIISNLPRGPFMRAIAIGCLSDALSGRPDKYELMAWIIRTSQNEIWQDLKREAKELLSIDSPLTRKAASWLLSFEGSEQALALKQSFPSPPPTSSLNSDHEDPCSSWLQWDRAQSVPCLEREDLNPEWVARQITHYAIDPSYAIPDAVVSRLLSLIASVDKQQMWVVLGKTAEDYRVDTAEPILASHAPHDFAEFIRSLAREMSHRTDIGRRQLSIALKKHYLILSDDEKEVVKSSWQKLISSASTWNKTDKETELFLFEVVLPLWSAEDQLTSLLQRPVNSLDLVAYENNFSPLLGFNIIKGRLVKSAKVEDLRRTLWFLAAHPSAVPVDLLNDSIVPLLNSESSVVRSKVLELVYEIKDEVALECVVKGTWTWDPSRETFENHWGSLLLSEHGQNLPFSELCRRIDPSYLGYAVSCRGHLKDEVAQYSQLVDEVLLRIAESKADLPLDLPAFTVESGIKDRIKHVPRWSLAEPSGFSITFESKYSRWGGVEENADANFEDWNVDVDLERRRTMVGIIHDAIDQQKKSGNVWFSRDFRGGALDEVVTARPDLVTQWISTADPGTREGREYIRRGGSFYDALCTALLPRETEKGIALYWRLQESQSRIRIVDSDTEIDLLDFTLFDIAESAKLVEAWQRKLEECQTDQDLAKIAMLAQFGKGSEWLWSYVSARVDSAIPIETARARVLLGFIDRQEARTRLEQIIENDPETWLLTLAKTAQHRQDKRGWAKHWFTQFVSSADDDSSWGAFRLLLRCVDTSFWFWRFDLEAGKEGVSIPPRRFTFLEDNEDDIQSAIQTNQKEAAEQFLGQKILNNQAWPWM